MNVNWLGEKNIIAFFVVFYGILATAWILAIYFVQEQNEVQVDKAKINYYGYSIAALSYAMSSVCLANWYFFSICTTCAFIFVASVILVLILFSVTRITLILATVLEIAKKTSSDEAWLMFYQDVSKAFKYVAIFTAFVYILPIISMLAHVCFAKGDDEPPPSPPRQQLPSTPREHMKRQII